MNTTPTPQADAESFIRDLLWNDHPECCGCPVVGAEYMGQKEMVCCGNPEPAMLNDKQIVATLRAKFPEVPAESERSATAPVGAGERVPAAPAELKPEKPMSDAQRQVFDQCRCVTHMAKALASVHEARAYIVNHDPELQEVIGSSTAQIMEVLGDMLDGMDAVDPEADEWMADIFTRAQVRFPLGELAAPAPQDDAALLDWLLTQYCKDEAIVSDLLHDAEGFPLPKDLQRKAIRAAMAAATPTEKKS